jgi:endonuclease/exonuclease/phosphatase family metal-dependent hydrolase
MVMHTCAVPPSHGIQHAKALIVINPVQRRLALLALAALTACARTVNYTDPLGPRFAGVSDVEPEPAWSGPHVVAAAVSTEFPTPDSLRVVTFNVHYSERMDLVDSLLLTSPMLRNADVIVLQEMNEEAAAETAEALGMNYVYYPALHHPVPKKNFGNAILSRWPIIEDEKLILPSKSMTRGGQRVAVAATVVVGTERVRVFAVHLSTVLEVWFTGQTYQAQAVLESAQGYDKVIVAGDMNSHDNVGAIFTDAGYFWPSRNTGPTTHKLFAVDHVFSRGFTVGGSAAVQDNLGASDHLPVWASLAFRRDQQTASK